MRIELYRFVYGDGEESESCPTTVYLFTSCGEPVIYNEETYIPEAMGRSQIEQKAELARASVDITVPLNNTMAQPWILDKLHHVVSVTLFEVNTYGPGSGAVGIDDANVIWKGRLVSTRPGTKDLKLVFESIITSLRRAGLKQRMLRRCRHSLYRSGCNLSQGAFEDEGTIIAKENSSTFQVTLGVSRGNDYFSLGMISWHCEYRFVIAHSEGDSTVITLMHPWPELARALDENGDQDIKLYPGCDRTRVTCDGKFDNLNNYGGFDWIPVRNPLDGSSIL